MNKMENRGEDGKFLKGRKETQEEKLKRIQALKSQWKERKDYIGDLKIRCPQIYNIWRAFMFTKKGKFYGHSEEWSNFRTFFNDVYPSYQEGYRFRRKDTDLPFSKDNFMWVSPNNISDIRSIITLTYNGDTYSLKEWSTILGVSYNGIRQRYSKGKNYSTEEILFGKLRKNHGKVTSISTISDEQKRKNKISKMLSAYRCKDRKKGFITNISKEYLEDIIYNGKCIYCGDTHNIGLDRIDNNRGHEVGNVVPCCYECNIARGNNFSFEEMLIIGKTIKQIKKNRIKNINKNETGSKKNI